MSRDHRVHLNHGPLDLFPMFCVGNTQGSSAEWSVVSETFSTFVPPETLEKDAHLLRWDLYQVKEEWSFKWCSILKVRNCQQLRVLSDQIFLEREVLYILDIETRRVISVSYFTLVSEVLSKAHEDSLCSHPAAIMEWLGISDHGAQIW